MAKKKVSSVNNIKGPAGPLSPQQRRWCELVGIYGYRYSVATRECYPKIKNEYNKSWQLRRNTKITNYLEYLHKQSMKEPERLLLQAFASAAMILRDSDHRSYTAVFNTIAKLSGRMDRVEENKEDNNLNINISFDD